MSFSTTARWLRRSFMAVAIVATGQADRIPFNEPTSSALSLTTAVYRLDRTNTRATDPNEPTRIVQTGSQRTSGCEVGLNGRPARLWTIAGG